LQSLTFHLSFQFSDGQFNKVTFVEMAKAVAGGNEKLAAIAVELADECEVVAVGDRCEQVYNFQKCLHDGVKSRQIAFPM